MRYIYFVGKPFLHQSLFDSAQNNDYKIGVFLDSAVSLKNPEKYDSVIELDFSSKQSLLDSVEGLDLQVDALLCTYENYIVSKSVLAEHFGVPAPSVESAEACTDKNLMRQAFMRKDPSISPQFGLVSTREELLSLASTMRYPLILKPTNLVKSLLVLKCSDEAELINNYEYAKSRIVELYEKYNIHGREPQLIIEEFISGRTCSIAAFVDRNGVPHFCDGIADLANARDIGVDDNYIYARNLPADYDPELQAKLFEVAKIGIDALSMSSTPAHVELIYNDAEVKLIEIGARIGGYRPRMYDISYGIDLTEQEIALALGITPILNGDFKCYSAVYELFPDREGSFVSIEGEIDQSAYSYFSIKAVPGQPVGPAKNGHKACAIIIAQSPDKIIFENLCKNIDSLSVQVSS